MKILLCTYNTTYNINFLLEKGELTLYIINQYNTYIRLIQNTLQRNIKQLL